MIGGHATTAAELVVACDAGGHLTGVINDEIGLAVEMGRPFASLFDEACADKAESFLHTLREHQAAFDWELTARTRAGRLLSLHFGGGARGDGFLIVGARSRAGVARACETLLGADSEQAEALRAAIRDLTPGTRERVERDDEVYEELTQINNELAAAQRELAKKNAELARLNEQKNLFLGIAAHDLRNPLGVILAFSGFLKDEAANRLTPEQLEFIHTIERSSSFMLKLVNDLLDISQIEAGRLGLELERADLREIVRRNVALNRTLAERKEIGVEFAPQDTAAAATVMTRLDVPKIEQTLNNLIGNAIKFSPRGSRIVVTLEVAGAEAIISIKDEGQGIHSGELERLFKPFTTGRAKTTGGERSTGLGLAIVKRIIEGHGGRISVASEAGKGATFTVALPLRS